MPKSAMITALHELCFTFVLLLVKINFPINLFLECFMTNHPQGKDNANRNYFLLLMRKPRPIK